MKRYRIEFKSESAQIAFDYLVKAFLEDYTNQGLQIDKCGWRTLMDLVKCSGISKHSVYGTSNRYGKAIAELKRKKVVETRYFSGERGRGGKILKLRINYEKAVTRNYLESRQVDI